MQAAPPSRKRCAPCPPPTVARALAAVKYDAPLPAVRPPHAFTHPVCPRTAPACCCLFRVSPVTVPLFSPPPRPVSTVSLPLGGYPRPCRLAAFPPVSLPPLFCPRCLIPAVPPLRLSTSPFFPPCRPVPTPVPTPVPSRHLSRPGTCPFAVCLFAPPSLSPLRFFHRKDREEPTFSAPPRVAPSVTVTKSGGFRRAAATGGGVSSTHFSPAVRYRMHKSPEHETRGRGG